MFTLVGHGIPPSGGAPHIGQTNLWRTAALGQNFGSVPISA